MSCRISCETVVGPVDPQMPLLSKSNLVPSPQHWTEYPAWHAGIFLQTEPRAQNCRAQYEACGWRWGFSCSGGCCPPNTYQQSFNVTRLHRRPLCWTEVDRPWPKQKYNLRADKKLVVVPCNTCWYNGVAARPRRPRAPVAPVWRGAEARRGTGARSSLRCTYPEQIQ